MGREPAATVDLDLAEAALLYRRLTAAFEGLPSEERNIHKKLELFLFSWLSIEDVERLLTGIKETDRAAH
jgi:hypothetical protein